MHVWALGLSFQGPGLQRHHQNSTRRHPERDKKSENGTGEGKKKKREILGLPPFGAPPFWAPTFSRFGPPPFEASQFGAHPPPTRWVKRHWPKQVWPNQVASPRPLLRPCFFLSRLPLFFCPNVVFVVPFVIFVPNVVFFVPFVFFVPNAFLFCPDNRLVILSRFRFLSRGVFRQ